MTSPVLKAHDTNPRFNTGSNCSFSLSQKHNPNQPVRNFLVKCKRLICPKGPQHAPTDKETRCFIRKPSHYFSLKKRCPSPKTILYFLLLVAPLPHPFVYKNLPFCITHRSALLVARWVAAQFMNCLIKPVRSSN